MSLNVRRNGVVINDTPVGGTRDPRSAFMLRSAVGLRISVDSHRDPHAAASGERRRERGREPRRVRVQPGLWTHTSAPSHGEITRLHAQERPNAGAGGA